jgi:hypothetical protein
MLNSSLKSWFVSMTVVEESVIENHLPSGLKEGFRLLGLPELEVPTLRILEGLGEIFDDHQGMMGKDCNAKSRMMMPHASCMTEE